MIAALSLILAFSSAGENPNWPAIAAETLVLLCRAESSYGRNMVGDGGAARGWLQQHRGHWRDGCEYLGVNWKWPEDTRDWNKCQNVALANWFRYNRAALLRGDMDLLVRTHRLPFAPYRADNDAYVRRVLGKDGGK